MRIITALIGCVLLCLITACPPDLLGQQKKDFPIDGDRPLPDRVPTGKEVQGTAFWLPSPIRIPLRMEKPGYVTLVIEDRDGKRVRNLISETHLEAGLHSIPWDGVDETSYPGDHPGASVPLGHFVSPGKYTVRGLVRDKVDVRYEFAAYTEGNPPWRTSDGKGGWLADHSPPYDVVFLPGKTPRMLIGSFVAEAGDGLVWTDLDGKRLAGRRGIGAGNGWWGAALLARDAGPKADPQVEAYLAGSWENFLEIWAVGPNRKALKHTINIEKNKDGVAGLAAHNKLLVASVFSENKLLFVSADDGKILASASLPEPRGARFDTAGRLVVLSGKRLLRFSLPELKDKWQLPEPEVLVDKGLEDPRHVDLDSKGGIYISDRGASHQVKVFTAEGKPARTIGSPGGARIGAYDPTRMDRPNGLAISGDDRLWVAEESHTPRRVSIWSLDGKLVKAFYGPTQYGGGGILTPDKKSFLYAQGTHGLQFNVDWEKGNTQLSNIYYLGGGPGDVGLPGGWTIAPQTPISFNDRLYLTNAFNSNPSGGIEVAGLWQMRNGIAKAVAAAGATDKWPLLATKPFLDRRQLKGNQLFVWSDLNDDGKVQPEEVSFTGPLEGAGPIGTTSISPGLVFVNGNSTAFHPSGFTPGGAPHYDAAKTKLLVAGLTSQTGSDGGGESMLLPGGWVVVPGGPMRGFRDGKLVWTYPSSWPSLHASHFGEQFRIARITPPVPGLMVGTTRLIGPPITPKNSDVGPIWATNGNLGNSYLMTADGLFVATLLSERRVPGAHSFQPAAERGTLLNQATSGEENFWPALIQTEDGKVYLQTSISGGGRLAQSTIARIDGLDSIKRLPATTIEVTPKLLAATHDVWLKREADRITKEGRKTYSVKSKPIKIDGKLDDWAGLDWIHIGDFPWHHRWYGLEVATVVSDDRLVVALRTPANRFELGDLPKAASMNIADVFRQGGAIDVFLGSDPTADPERIAPVAGDVRLLVSLVKDKPVAQLCRFVAKSDKPVTFQSDWRKTTYGAVEDVSESLLWAKGEDHNPGNNSTFMRFEFSIPLKSLGLVARPGTVINADVGVIRKVRVLMDPPGLKLSNLFWSDNGHYTIETKYWHNKATTFVPDLAGHAQVSPRLWGAWRFVADK